jgi:hypothetical protein
MRSNRSFLPLVLLTSSFVLGQTATPGSAADYVGQVYGAPLSAATPVAIEAALPRAKELSSGTVAVSGRVSAVCQQKGCWLTLVGGQMGTTSVHMTFKDYGFFVPKDLIGYTVVAEGIFKTETVSVDDQRHLAKDAGKSKEEIERITEAKVETSFEAAGVRVIEGPK